MTETGVVTAVDGNMATVKFERKEACGNCNLCGKKSELSAENLCGASVGDTVNVELPETAFLLSAFAAYGGLFVAFVVGAVGGYAVSKYFLNVDSYSEIIGLIIGFAFILAFRPLLKKFGARMKMPAITGPV